MNRGQLSSLEEVLSTHVPLLAHIPVSARPRVRDELVLFCCELEASTADEEAHRACTTLFPLPASILFTPDGATKDYLMGKIVKRRLLHCEAGEAQALRKEAYAAARRRAGRSKPPNACAGQLDRGRTQAHDGAYSKAVATQVSGGVHELADEVQAALVQKHPRIARPNPLFDKRALGASFPSAPAPVKFSVPDVREAIKSAPPRLCRWFYWAHVHPTSKS